MPMGPFIMASIPWTELIKAAPILMESTRKLYESVRNRPPRTSQPSKANSDDIPTLRADLSELQERTNSLEANNEEQAELIAQMARHQAAMLRWLTILALTTVVTGAVAIAALIFVFLR